MVDRVQRQLSAILAADVARYSRLAGQNADTSEDRKIELRIGINVGDVVIDGDDIYGDGSHASAALSGYRKMDRGAEVSRAA